MKKILVTGGAGYIGSKLVTELLNNNYEVTVVDILKYSSKSLNHLFNNKNLHFIKGDVRNRKLMRKLTRNYLRPFEASFFVLGFFPPRLKMGKKPKKF